MNNVRANSASSLYFKDEDIVEIYFEIAFHQINSIIVYIYA